MLAETESLSMAVAQGEYDVLDCQLNSMVELPLFNAKCFIRGDDTSSNVDVFLQAPGRMLSNAVAGFTVFRGVPPTSIPIMSYPELVQLASDV